ncbi:Glycerophosphodiester phosphodiesterase gde1 [Porphyridium purpureum]|uniref:Glycerophosphodiester phosphodiesterase gde1 n=1 Tax=Porphyridium purpureum TaxID=35688 RepID=A0A5J4Z4J6_PORPP|nr:Glycerophosphodiester phosphodiesterase gde1 [Porphyridium purpureum]|eukprot:POR0291..scf295_1
MAVELQVLYRADTALEPLSPYRSDDLEVLSSAQLRVVLGDPVRDRPFLVALGDVGDEPTVARLLWNGGRFQIPICDTLEPASREPVIVSPIELSPNGSSPSCQSVSIEVETRGGQTWRAAILVREFAPKMGCLTRALMDERGLVVASATVWYQVISPFNEDGRIKHAQAPTLLNQIRHGDAEKLPFLSRAKPGMCAPRLIGHRGYGAHNEMVLENTMLSFETYVNQPAESDVRCIELDVQLTKDLVPVIHHDYYVHDGMPVFSHTLEQVQSAFGRKTQAMQDLIVGLKLDRIPTLQTVCDSLPERTSLLVELKYPSWILSERETLPYPERNVYADAVLEVLFNSIRSANRKIFLLTFDPDLASVLRLKQSIYDVFLLNNSDHDDSDPRLDERVSTARKAVAFARANRLQGCVFRAEMVLNEPDLVTHAHELGLYVLTYGAINSDPGAVRSQQALCVDAVISDHVPSLVLQLNQPHSASSVSSISSSE